MTIFGWDASDFDWSRGPMDLGAAVRDGISFFTHKATEGTRTRHVHYGEAMRRARAAGMPLMGAYVVPRTPGNGGHGSIAAQVDYYLAYLDAQTPWWRSTKEFFHQVDSEHWGYDNVSPALGAQMCAMLRAKTGQWVIHYAPRWGYGDTIPGGEPLWASSYGANPAVHYRQVYPGDGSSGWAPYSGRTPTFLQYGSRVTIGRQSTCDINAFRGSLDQLRALITGGTAMAGEADKAFSAPYTGTEPFISGQSWMSKALERPLREANTKLADLTDLLRQVLIAQGAEQEDIAALLARPAVTLDADQLADLGEQLAAVLVARPDTPLGEADIPAMKAALDQFFQTRFGQPAEA